VVAVQVRDEDGAQVVQRERRVQDTVLGTLAAVDERPAAPGPRSARPLTLRVLLGVPDEVPRNWNSMS